MATARQAERQEIVEWLEEARQALRRQWGGPFDRGDLHTIMESLETLLEHVEPEMLM